MITRALLFLLFACSFFELHSAHIISGTMGYNCNGDGTYTMELVLFRDCAGPGADFDNFAPIAVYNNGSHYATLSVERTTFESVELESYENCDLNLTAVCVEKATYVFDVGLLPSDHSYEVVYQRCCWSETVSNIVNPGSRGITVLAEITPAAQIACNNRPPVNFPMSFAACPNEPVSIPLPLTDAEGDSLSYSICQPLEGGGLLGTSGNPGDPAACDGVAPDPPCVGPYNELEYVDGFDNENPFPSENGITYNPETQMLEFTPTVLGRFVYGLCVSEYRDGEFLGDYRQTIQVSSSTETIISNKNLNQLDAWRILNSVALNTIRLERNENSLSKVSIELIGINGEKIQSISSSDRWIEIPVSELASGMYMVSILEEGKTQLFKVIVK